MILPAQSARSQDFRPSDLDSAIRAAYRANWNQNGVGFQVGNRGCGTWAIGVVPRTRRPSNRDLLIRASLGRFLPTGESRLVICKGNNFGGQAAVGKAQNGLGALGIPIVPWYRQERWNRSEPASGGCHWFQRQPPFTGRSIQEDNVLHGLALALGVHHDPMPNLQDDRLVVGMTEWPPSRMLRGCEPCTASSTSGPDASSATGRGRHPAEGPAGYSSQT